MFSRLPQRSAAIAALIFWTACGETPIDQLPDTGVVAPDSGMPPPDAGLIIDGQASVNPAILDFGVAVLDTTVSRTLTINNPGAVPASVALGDLSGPNAALFTVAPFAAQELAPGAMVTVEITMTATVVGPAFANIIVLTCAEGCPVSVSLVGEVKLNAVACAPTFNFGTVNPGVCANGRVSCTNEGNIDATIETASLDPLGDPELALNATLFPLTIASGASADVEVIFCPESVGDFFGRLFVLDQTTELRGHGGGSALSCRPDTINFGVVGVGSSAARTFLCENNGFEAATISGIVAQPNDFSAGTAVASVGVGEFVELTVTVSPLGAGDLVGELTINSDDPNSPIISIALLATAIEVGEDCVPELSPASFDFGLVGIGDSRFGSMTLRNNGGSSCLIASVAVGIGGDIAFTSIPNGAIDPGQSISIGAVFEPTQNGMAMTSMQLSFANPNTLPVSAVFQGTGGEINLVASPGALDFGVVAAGCASPAIRVATLQNSGFAALIIDSITVAGTSSAAFTIDNPISGPVQLDFLESIEVQVNFDPAQLGPANAELRIVVQGTPAPIVVQLLGSGEANAARVDTISLGVQKLDILFMIDNSASMGPGQNALSAAIPRFASRLIGTASDFHVGMVTTDMVDPAHAGRLQGTPVVIDAATPSPATAIANRVISGTGGDGANESPFDAIVAALTSPLADNENLGFLRPDARLVIIALSDEDDQSNIEVNLAAGQIRRAAGTGVSLFAIVGNPGQGCNGPQGMAAASPRWGELTARLGGQQFSYCGDVDDHMDAIIASLFDTTRASLSADPVPETITVTQNGSPVPSANWQFRRASTSVVFTSTASLGSDPIEIAYQAYCLSETCGNGMVETFESCDDANAANDDGCTAGCRLAICGDTFIESGNEACDDGNEINTDACLNSCAAPVCGDGILSSTEDCDDSNTINGDGCPANCNFQTDLTGYYTAQPLAAATYVPLAMETPVVFTGGEDDGFGTIAVPFTFNFFGLPLTSIDASPNGLIASSGLVAGSAFQNGGFPDLAAPNGIIAAWWDDLAIDNAVTGGASLAYEVQGTSPNQVLVIQWRSVRRAQHNTNNHRRFNFQIALFEGTDVIEIRYGETATSGNPATATSASVGVENQDATVGAALLTCSPNCQGPARPQNANGFPRASVLVLTP